MNKGINIYLVLLWCLEDKIIYKIYYLQNVQTPFFLYQQAKSVSHIKQMRHLGQTNKQTNTDEHKDVNFSNKLHHQIYQLRGQPES